MIYFVGGRLFFFLAYVKWAPTFRVTFFRLYYAVDFQNQKLYIPFFGCCCCYNHINLCFLNYDGGFGYSLWQETLCKKKKKNRHLQSSKKTFIFLKIGLFCFFFCLQENGKVDWSKKNNIGLPKLHKIIKKKKRVDSYFFIIYKFCPERM